MSPPKTNSTYQAFLYVSFASILVSLLVSFADTRIVLGGSFAIAFFVTLRILKRSLTTESFHSMSGIIVLATTVLIPEVETALGTINLGTFALLIWFGITVTNSNRIHIPFKSSVLHVFVLFTLLVTILIPYSKTGEFEIDFLLRNMQWGIILGLGPFLWSQIYDKKQNRLFGYWLQRITLGLWLSVVWSFWNGTYVARTVQGDYIRAIGFTDSVNAVGGILLFFLILSYYNSTNKKWLIINGVGCLLGIFLTGSRTASLILMMIGIILIASFILSKNSVSGFHLFSGIAAIVLFSVLVFLVTNLNPQLSVLQVRFMAPVQYLLGNSQTGFVEDRSWIWRKGIEIWLNTPLYPQLAGTGFGQSWLINASAYNPAGYSFHNLYVTLLLEFGLVGTMLFFLVVLQFAIRFFRILQFNKELESTISLERNQTIIPLGLIFFAILLFNITEVFLYGVTFSMMFAFCVGKLQRYIFHVYEQ